MVANGIDAVLGGPFHVELVIFVAIGRAISPYTNSLQISVSAMAGSSLYARWVYGLRWFQTAARYWRCSSCMRESKNM